MVTALAKLKELLNSKLENQKSPAQLLVAVEQSLEEQQASSSSSSSSTPRKDISAAEYFLALESMLERAAAKGSPPSLLPSTFYILAIVAPHVSPGILRARLSSLLPYLFKVLSNPHPTSNNSAESHSALLRSALSIFHAIIAPLSRDRALLQSETQLQSCWDVTLNLCADSRPKVRRKAHEIISDVLSGGGEDFTSSQPHPYAARTAGWTVRTLASVVKAGGVASSKTAKVAEAAKYDVKKGLASGAAELAKQRQSDAAGGASVGIWICGFLKVIVGKLPEKHIPQICEDLLRLPGLQNPFLTVSTFEVFEALYKPAKSFNAAATNQAGSSGALAAVSATASVSPSSAPSSLVKTLEALNSEVLRPSTSDVQLLSPYLRALEGAMVAYARYEAGQAAWKLFPAMWDQVMAMSLSAKSDASRSSGSVRTAGREALSSFVRYCIPDAAIKEAVDAKDPSKTSLGQMISSIDSALGKYALRYTHSRGEIFNVLAALVSKLRLRVVKSKGTFVPQPAAISLLMPLIRSVAEMRVTPKFEHREQADLVLGAATEVCGPEAILKELPLGLFGELGAGKEGRAWLLPLMRGRITNASLSHFVKEIVPLSEKLFNTRAEAEADKGRAVEAKMYEALVEQLWALFPGYCDLPVDLTTGLTQDFAGLLANVLYSQQPLRPSVLRGLTLLVERNEALARSGASDETLQLSFGITSKDGKDNLQYLVSLAPSFLSVFSQVLTQSPASSRGYITEAIGAYLRILPAAEVKNTYDKVRGMLDSALTELVPQRDREVGVHAIPPTAHSMLDLLITLVPFLPVSEGSALLTLAESDALLKHDDAGVQKKTYRILARLVEGNKGEALLRSGKGTAANVSELLRQLHDATVNVSSGAKRDRLNLLAALVPRIPSTELHLLPSIIPEAVLATKEANQGSRETAYDLLVQMGRKMQDGGKIKRGLLEGDTEEGGDAIITDDSEIDATLVEYFTMVGAGLAGGSPHMISASITSFSRLIYEFKADLDMTTLNELVSTINVFLSSPNREVVKSVLGFVKVTIVSLEHDLVNQHLGTMVPAMLNWTPEHRAHFKAKVRHIFERLLRRFGYERIVSLTDEENRKLVVNIKKRKDRAKRKKVVKEGEQQQGEDEDEDGAKVTSMGGRVPKSHGVDAFEEALYGSESDISDSDSDDEGEGGATVAKLGNRAAGARGGRQGARGGASVATTSDRKQRRRREDGEDAYLLEDDDEPMDLLDRSASAAGKIRTGRQFAAAQGNAASQNRRRPGVEANKFSLDEETGRMVIEDPQARGAPTESVFPHGNATNGGVEAEAFGAGGAYVERSQGLDGHANTGRGGAVRFNKNNKRTRMEEQELELQEMAREDAATAAGGGGQTGFRKGGKPVGKPQREHIGKDFRAKKAKGDVKKSGGQDPYAYVPLSSIGGKKSKGAMADVDITGKGGKRRR